MPILGLTDQPVGVRAFPHVGTIRKGAPKQPNAPGADLDYFRVEFLPGEEESAQLFAKLYGTQPRNIDIVLPFNDVDRVWEAWREAYVAGALIHRCDGRIVHYAINPKTGETLVRNGVLVESGEPVFCSGKTGCKPQGRLRVIVPDLKRLAFLLVLTGSIHDILNISQQLESIRLLNQGQIAGVPLVLRRRPHKISTPSGSEGKRARFTKWLLSIEADPQWVKAKLDALQRAAMPDVTLLMPGSDATEMPEDFAGGSDDSLMIGSPCGEDEEEDEQPIFTCAECGQILVDFEAEGVIYTVSRLIDIGGHLDHPGIYCGQCLQEMRRARDAARNKHRANEKE